MISNNCCLGFFVFIQFKLTIANFFNKGSEITLQATRKSVRQLVRLLATGYYQIHTPIYQIHLCFCLCRRYIIKFDKRTEYSSGGFTKTGIKRSIDEYDRG